MKRKIFAFVIPLLAAYILLAPTVIQKELTFKPQWITDLTRAAIASAAESPESYPFRLGRLFGYISGEGELIYAEQALYNAAIGDDFFLNYSNVPNNLIARDKSGSIMFSTCAISAMVSAVFSVSVSSKSLLSSLIMSFCRLY